MSKTYIVLTLRRPRNFPTELAVKRRYILDRAMYSMETAGALINYAISNNKTVVFYPEGIEEGIVFNPEEYIARNPSLGGGAIGLMYEEGLDDEGAENF